MILPYFDQVLALALSYRWQNCNYLRTNKATDMKFSGNVENYFFKLKNILFCIIFFLLKFFPW